MKRTIYSCISNLADEPLELFWIAGLFLDDKNNWNVRCVFRGKLTGELFKSKLPIGMLPILRLGIWFDQGLLKHEDASGVNAEIIISNMADYDIITSAEIPNELYPLPNGKAGTQRLFRYRVGNLQVLIPVVELLRLMFIHNRALAIALMRPGGIEQLYTPQTPGFREAAQIRFAKEMPRSVIGSAFAQEFAWLVLDPQARRAWDSVQQLSEGQAYVLFQPPAIRNAAWSFRGIRCGDQWFVLELKTFTGRRLPFNELEYSHPTFRKTIVAPAEKSDGKKPKKQEKGEKKESSDKEVNVDGEGEGAGSTSYRVAKFTEKFVRQPAFENKVIVNKKAKEVEQSSGKSAPATGKGQKPKSTKTVQVTTSERAGRTKIPSLEFKMMPPASSANMGDLDALDETVRHMRDILPSVSFGMSLVQLKQGRAISVSGKNERSAMVVIITPSGKAPIVLLDVERTGIVALSLMALRFEPGVSSNHLEDSVKHMLDGWVDCGGHWSSNIEEQLSKLCQFERIPKILIPREKSVQLAKWWAEKLIERLGLLKQ
jgi:hypothetical protein